MAESKVKDGNYYVVQSFMVKELGLKGLERDLYAIIYGFSQAESQRFTGSLQYLSDWTNCSKQGILKALKSLEEKNLIARNERDINGVKFVEYYSTEFNGGDKLSLIEGGKLSLTNNINKNNTRLEYIKENIKKKKFIPPTKEEVMEYGILKQREDLVDFFFDYYNTGEWKNKDGKPVSNWKQTFITWINHNPQKQKEKKVKYEDGSEYAD